MAHNISNEYKQIIYSGDARNKLKLLFNNVELQDADRYCEKLTIKSRIIPNGAKIFSLNNFISKEVDLILHDIDTSIIQNQVSISIGTLVGNSYEYVPIGIFNIENQPTNDKNKTTIKLRDNSVKFDFNYNAQPLIEQNGGVVTKLQILQDICSQAGVTCNITSFVGYLDEIGVYDNTITAREYISRIAEQAGRIATINRSGELIFVDLNSLTTWEIPIEVVEKYENGTKYKIGRVVYEDGIVRYETPTSNDDTLFLDGSNNYINGELAKEQANSSNNSYSLQNTGEADLAYFELEGKTTQENDLILTNWEQGSSLDNNTTTRIRSKEIFKITKGKTYKLTWEGTNASSYQMIFNTSLNKSSYLFSTPIDVCGNNGNWSATSPIQFTATNDGYLAVIVSYRNGASITPSDVSNLKITLVDFMPSPDYPSELVSVGYNNIWDEKWELGSFDNNTGNPYWTSTKIRSKNYIPIQPNKQYYVATPITLNAYYYDSNKTFVSANTQAGINGVFTTPNNAYYMMFSTFGSSYTTYSNNIAIFKGTQAHNYIPYGKYGIEVKTTGKNLFDKNNANVINGYLSGSMKIVSANDDRVVFIPCKPNTKYYVTKMVQATTSSNRFSLGTTTTIPQANTTLADFVYLPNGTTETTFSITTGNNAKYLVCGIYHIDNSTTFDEMKNSIQIEQGTQATTYEEYKSNTYLYQLDAPLRSIGDTKDLLYIKNGMLYVDRNVGKVILNGSENWQRTYVSSSNSYAFWNTYSNLNIANGLVGKKHCNYFTYQQNVWSQSTPNHLAENSQSTPSILFNVDNTIATTVTEWQTWLSTHNTEVQYVLNEPYTEELGNIDMPITYEGITYLDISSSINTNSYLQYRQNKTQLEAILENTNQFSIDSLKTGKILGNPAIDSYDLIQIHDKSKNLCNYTSGNNLFITDTLSSGTYTMSFKNNSDGAFNIKANSQNGTTLFTIYLSSSTTSYTKTFTLNEDAKLFLNGWGGFNILNVQIEQSPIPTDYVPFKDETYTTLATNDLVYTGVLINTFDTQIGEEAKEQNVFINGEETFKKWARTTIDSVEGSISLQAGEIDTANGRINETNLRIDKDGALLNVLANNSNIDVQYDSEGNPLSGEVREVTTTTGFTFNAEGMTIQDTSSNFKAQHRNTGTYYKDGDTIVGQYTKDGSKQKDLDLFGIYTYGKNDINDTPMFIAQLFTDSNGEEAFGHFYNRGD